MGTSINYQFKDCTDQPTLFFDIIAQDWRDDIEPVWSDYKSYAEVYAILKDSEPIAGGIIFDICPLDIIYYEEEAKYWFTKGYRYLGFIWVNEDERGKGLGSLWLKYLKEKFPQQSFWLTVEEENLIEFYQSNNFKLVIEIPNRKEWLMVYDC